MNFLKIERLHPHCNLRIPSGNEAGVIDEFWLPGGQTSGGVLESVIEPVKKADVNNYKIKIIIQ